MQNSTLPSSFNYDNVPLDIEELESLLEARRKEMKRKEILSNYEIKQYQTGPLAGRWYAVIDKKKFESKDRSKLEDKIIKIHMEKETNSHYTLKTVYELEQEKQLARVTDPNKKISRQNTITRHDGVFRKYITGSVIENMPITKITDTIMEDFLISVNTPPIKKKEMNNLLGILNQTFRRAKRLKLIKENPLEYVDLDDILASCVDVTPAGERAYTHEELQAFLSAALDAQAKNPSDSTPWAYELCLLMAPRRGEVPPLEWDDVDFENSNISIRKQLLKNDKTNETVIKPQPKNHKTRLYPITPMIREFLNRLLERNREYYPDSKYLFPDKKEPLGIIRLRATYDFHHALCESMGIDTNNKLVKGPHAFRRSHETEFMSHGGSIEAAGRVYGNTPRTISNHYEIAAESKAAAPIIEEVQKNIFQKSNESNKNSKKREIARAR